VYCITQSGDLDVAFILNGTILMNATVAVSSSNKIVPTLYLIEVDFSLYQTNIGPFSISILDALLNTLFADGLIPIVNGLLSVGFPIPVVQNVELVNTTIGWGSHYLYISTDISYSPSPIASPSYVLSKIRVG